MGRKYDKLLQPAQNAGNYPRPRLLALTGRSRSLRAYKNERWK